MIYIMACDNCGSTYTTYNKLEESPCCGSHNNLELDNSENYNKDFDEFYTANVAAV